MNLLVLGSGGREHALCWKLAQSPLCDKLYCIPGNGGIAQKWETASIKLNDFPALVDFARDKDIDLTIVGPEAPLVEGIVDHFIHNGLPIFGPVGNAAVLEGDKAFAKDLMATSNIPTAKFSVHHSIESAYKSPYLMQSPAVIKASGLAAGKGVAVVETYKETEAFLSDIFEKRKFGQAGSTVVIEECLRGQELSYLVATDGEDFIAFTPSQDHKRIGEGDTGPNTGGMGAYAPAPIVSKFDIEYIEEKIVAPTLKALRKKGIIYRGILYCGLMLTKHGPKVLEYNCRFGDPETQCILPLVDCDLVELLIACTEDGGIAKFKKTRKNLPIYTHNKHCACVVLSSQGYPESYQTGFKVSGLDEAPDDTLVFHAGTKLQEGNILTAGGRVFGVTGLGKSLKEALNKAYSAVDKIQFEGKYFRLDIGWRAMKK
jgi:phosphoribosylamine--glycine ligase